MKYQKYFRKTSLKQKGVGDFFLSEISQQKPKIFLEVGVFHGVTARNVCELLFSIHGNDFKYIGLDLFQESDENKDEVIPNTKFKNNVSLIKGNSNIILEKIDMSKIEYVFLDGGHDYSTVINDLSSCSEVIQNNGVILCDDYDLSYAPGVKRAIDEFTYQNNLKCEIICNNRFAKIQKN